MTLQALDLPELLRLFAIFGGVMVLLYILKVRRRRVQVPFSPLWARVQMDRESSSLFKALKRLFSLLVQLAIVALLVLALGDPKVNSFLGCTHEDENPPPPRHTLVVIDASASMATLEGGKTRLELARAEAHSLIDKLTVHPNLRAMVVQLDATTRPLSLWTSEPKTLHAAVDALAPSPMDTPTSLESALDLARDALRGKTGAELVLITDRAFDPPESSKIESLDLRVIPVGASTDNIGLERFNLRPYPDDALNYVAWYAVRNEAPREVRATLFLYANPNGITEGDFITPSHLVTSLDLTLPPSGVLEGTLPDLKFEGSRALARVVVASQDPMRDAFPRDDLAFAVVPERKKLNVQLVTTGNLFLEAVVLIRENLTYKIVRPSDYQGPEGFDITIVDAVDVDMSRPGNYLAIAPPARDGFEISGTLTAPIVERLDKKHPLVKGLTFTDANILETAIYKTDKKDEVVARAQNGLPILFARKSPETGRRFVVLSFDARNSLLPMNFAFPLLIVNALNYFANEADGLLIPNRAGLPLSVAFPTEGETSLTLKGPTDTPVRRLGERVNFTPMRLGIWELSSVSTKETRALPIAVNLLSPEESRIGPRGDYPVWTPPEWVPPTRNPWLEDFWKVLLLTALALITIEWLTWHRRWTV